MNLMDLGLFIFICSVSLLIIVGVAVLVKHTFFD